MPRLVDSVPKYRLHRASGQAVVTIDVIQGQDGPRTWFYCDPPYLHVTRTAPEVYRHEMTTDQHGALLECLAGIRGRFTLSGYRSVLYDTVA